MVRDRESARSRFPRPIQRLAKGPGSNAVRQYENTGPLPLLKVHDFKYASRVILVSVNHCAVRPRSSLLLSIQLRNEDARTRNDRYESPTARGGGRDCAFPGDHSVKYALMRISVPWGRMPMAHIQYRARDPGGYPGPTREELGDLAGWVTESEFAELRTGSRAAPSPTPVPEAPRVRRQDPKPYVGPTREELGDLATWLDARGSRRSANGRGSSPSAPSSREIKADLWSSEMDAIGANAVREAKATLGQALPSFSSDPFLSQLDEIQVALRKRAFQEHARNAKSTLVQV